MRDLLPCGKGWAAGWAQAEMAFPAFPMAGAGEGPGARAQTPETKAEGLGW